MEYRYVISLDGRHLATTEWQRLNDESLVRVRTNMRMAWLCVTGAAVTEESRDVSFIAHRIICETV